MDYKSIMVLPANIDNTIIFDYLKTGTDPECFAYANLIEWAIRNKKYVEYYSHIAQFTEDKNRWKEQERLHDEKIVIVRFNFAAVPLFGFYCEDDGEPALMFPDKDGNRIVYL